MDALYLLMNPNRPEEYQLPANVRLGAVYSDTVGQEQTALRSCLDSLQDGDTLYIARERHLSRDFCKAIDLLGSLARRGINVWLGRTGQLLDSKSSPFLEFGPEAGEAIVDFCKAFTRHKSSQGFRKALSTGVRPGRRKKALPENFGEVCAAWKEGRITQ